jgi:alpha-tubulin suppressor-like RCC1 family protein
LGLAINTPIPTKVLVQNNESFYKVESGDGFSILTTTYTGKLYGFGRNDVNQIQPNYTSNVPFPVEIKDSSKYGNYSSFAIGGTGTTFHVIAIATNQYQTLYGWGSNSNGQLGSGSTGATITPASYQSITPIRTTGINVTSSKVSLGLLHTVLLGSISPLTTPINLHVFGSNNNGQIAQSGFERNLAFRVQLSEKVSDIAAGDSHTLFIKANELFVMGDNTRGQIGLGSQFQKVSILTKLNFTKNSHYPIQVWAGSYSSFLLTTEGLYVTGDNTEGALGLPIAQHYKDPVLHPFDKFKTDKVLKVSSAKGSGQHTLVLTEAGDVYSMGIGSSGQLGTNNYTSSFAPVLITAPSNLPTGYKALDISAGVTHSIIIYGSKSCPLDCKPNNILKGECDTVQGRCKCFSQYLGVSCELFQCQDPLCSSQGVCDTSNGICKCDAEHEGKTCQYRKCPNACSGNGICERTTGTCQCNGGFTGVDCATPNFGNKIGISVLLVLSCFFYLLL